MGRTALDRDWSEGESLADLLEQIGNVPLDRIPLRPPPGTASELDVLTMEQRPRKKLCELVDGVLVEKAMGSKEALLGLWLGHLVWGFLDKHDLGIALGADGMLKLFPGQVRIPDLSFISWDRLPNGEPPDEPIWGIVPNLAVEVISKGNTKAEMKRKLRDYFFAGVQVVWYIYPETQTAEIYTSPTKKRRIGKDQALTAESVLPGFSLPLRELFRRRKKP
jgi:Uma2 family endonuclease